MKFNPMKRIRANGFILTTDSLSILVFQSIEICRVDLNPLLPAKKDSSLIQYWKICINKKSKRRLRFGISL
jgi:hypothetical protein